MDNRAVGIFDSGMGGLSVLKTAQLLLPAESFLFYGDNKNAPYGTRSPEEITRLSFDCAHELVKLGAKALVIACNTATSAAVNDIRTELKLPVVSMEPAIMPAIEHSKGGRILMMATPRTCVQSRYLRLLDRLDQAHQVVNVPAIELVEAVESGDWSRQAFDRVLQKVLGPFEGQAIESIVLGCTHFPFAREHIARYARAHFQGKPAFYDGNLGTARQLGRVLKEQGLEAEPGRAGATRLLTSGDSARILPLFNRLLAQYDPF